MDGRSIKPLLDVSRETSLQIVFGCPEIKAGKTPVRRPFFSNLVDIMDYVFVIPIEIIVMDD